MASIYPNTRLTNYGRELIARSQATGKKLQYIKLVTGDGQLDNQNIDTMTSVLSPKLECPFTSNGKFVGDGQFRVEFAVGNSTVNSGFFARELGVYANLEGESDSAAKLIAYSNGGNYASYIPSKETPINSKVFSLDVVIGNSTNVTVKKIDAAYLTRGALDDHNNDNNAHAELLKLFLRLTGGELNGDLIIKNHLFKLKNVNNKEMLIRFNNDNTLDIGNAYNGDGINGISLCSIKRPGWYNGSGSTKGFALLEEFEPIKTLLGQGAIVASKLDTNGFVKFANGFIIQWGGSGDDNSAKSIVTYPIAFKQVFISCAIDAFWEGSNTPKYLSNSSNESTNTRAVFVGNDRYVGSYYWFAFGLA